MMEKQLKLIDEKEAKKIKEIILKTKLIDPISIILPSLNLNLNVNAKETEAKYSGMDGFYLTYNGSRNILKVNEKQYQVYLNIGNWGYQGYRFIDTHICLGTNWTNGYFAQLELSQCVKDDTYIYLIKNISNQAGPGAIVRIDNGLGATKEDKFEKLKRRQRLADFYEDDVIQYEDQEWLCVNQILIKDLNDRKRYPNILHQFLRSFLKFAFRIEYIINTPKVEIELKGGYVKKRYFSNLTQIQKKNIENKAMEVVKEYFVSKGYVLKDVSLQRGLGYDYLAIKGSKEYKVEVKGTTLDQWMVNLTRNEYMASEKHKERFILFIVTFDDVTRLNKVDQFLYTYPSRSKDLAIVPSQYTVRKKG